jgi:hypothetical protein
MSLHPVQLHVLRAERLPRIQVVVRVVLVVALGLVARSEPFARSLIGPGEGRTRVTSVSVPTAAAHVASRAVLHDASPAGP